MKHRSILVAGIMMGLLVFISYGCACAAPTNLMRSFGDISLGDRMSEVQEKLKRHSKSNSMQAVSESNVTLFREASGTDIICGDLPLPAGLCKRLGITCLYGLSFLNSPFRIGKVSFLTLRFTFQHDRLVHMGLSTLADDTASGMVEEILQKYQAYGKKRGSGPLGRGFAGYLADSNTGILLVGMPSIGPGTLLFNIYDLAWVQLLKDHAERESRARSQRGRNLIR